MAQYRVTGMLIRATTMTERGWQVVDLHEGATVPADVTDDWIAHHLRKELIEVEEPEGKPEAAVREPVTAGAAPKAAAPAVGKR